MNWTFYKALLTRYTNFGKSCIALAFMLFSFSLSRAEISSAEVQEIITILNHSLWNNDPTISPSIPSSLQEVTDFQESLGAYLTGGTDIDSGFNYRNRDALPFHLQALIYGITGWNPQSNTGFDWSLHGDLQSLLAAVSNLNSSGSSPSSTNIFNVSVQPTNIINLTAPISPDVLAGNPWWATNSAFATWINTYTDVFPRFDYTSSATSMNFPEFLSAWSTRLMTGGPWADATDFDWRLQWGYDWLKKYMSGERRRIRGYSWFDWMTDATRSNWVASASYNSDLLRELRALSNALVSASASASINVTNQTYVFLTNLVTLSADDILAGNPWWSTNSAFSQTWLSYQGVYPDDFGILDPSLSFPQAFSALLSTLLPDLIGFFPDTPDYWGGEWQRYGLGGQNQASYSIYRPRLSWFDWVSEAMKSNLVLQVAPNYDTLTATVARAYSGTDVEEMPATNSVLSAYDEAFDAPDTSDIEQSFSDTMDEAESKLQDIASQYGRSGSAEIVVIPEFMVGGIHVREYRGSLDTSLTRVAHAVCVFLYTVFFIVATLHLVKVEWAFWSSLGTPVE